jgi:hypothetical protein
MTPPRLQFQMPQPVFNRIYTAFSVTPEFVRKANALGVFRLHRLQRIVAAIRMLGYGTAADACEKYIRVWSHRLLTHFVSFVKPYVRSLAFPRLAGCSGISIPEAWAITQMIVSTVRAPFSADLQSPSQTPCVIPRNCELYWLAS